MHIIDYSVVPLGVTLAVGSLLALGVKPARKSPLQRYIGIVWVCAVVLCSFYNLWSLERLTRHWWPFMGNICLTSIFINYGGALYHLPKAVSGHNRWVNRYTQATYLFLLSLACFDFAFDPYHKHPILLWVLLAIAVFGNLLIVIEEQKRQNAAKRASAE